MWEDDFISGLTQEVREEVVRNYLYERRILEEQIHYVKELAQATKAFQDGLVKRFARIRDLLMEPDFMARFVAILGLKSAPPFLDEAEKETEPGSLRFIKIRAMTDRSKYKKLLGESYKRLYLWADKYNLTYEELREECRAVNHNIKTFETNFDLLEIIRFLKNMDVVGLEKKRFLGDNFTAKEMGSVEMSLRFAPLRMKDFHLTRPLKLPPPSKIRKPLNQLADCVFGTCKTGIKAMVR